MEAMVPMMDVRACGRPDSYGQIFDDKKDFVNVLSSGVCIIITI